MTRSEHDYALLLSRADGTRLGEVPVRVDWEPAVEWARFEASRHGATAFDGVDAAVEPLWHARRGAPFLSGFRVVLHSGEREIRCGDLATTYFKDLARRASSEFVESGQLEGGERFRFHVLAFPRAREPVERVERASFTTEEAPPRPPEDIVELASLQAASAPVGVTEPEDIPVFVPHRVLEEAAELARREAENETGGVLIGRLHRDTASAELFVEVTAQVPARHVVAEAARLRFTSETWSEVQQALDLRRRDESMVGWWHSHPARLWCRDCPEEKRRACPLSRGFLSEHDRHFHRTAFLGAHNLALVVTDAAEGLSYSMFGWRRGLVEPRGFHVVGAPGPPLVYQPAARAATGGPDGCGHANVP